MAKASTVQTRTRCVRLGRPWVGELWGREFPTWVGWLLLGVVFGVAFYLIFRLRMLWCVP